MIAGSSEEVPEVPNVEIYVKMMCPYCFRAKHLLDAKGIDYEEISVDFGGPRKVEMVSWARVVRPSQLMR